MTSKRAAVAGALLLCSLLYASCSGGSGGSGSTASDGGSTPSSAAAPEGEGSNSGGGSFGCTDAMIAYMDANGYSDPTPRDVSGFSLPEAAKPDIVPVCFVDDEFGSAHRKGAIFTGDVATVVAAVGAPLAAAGYQQSAGYGTSIWWLGGDDPSSAKYAIGAGPQTIGGESVVWMTWSD